MSTRSHRRLAGTTRRRDPDPVPESAPFWTPLTPEERAKLGKPTAFDEVALRAGWAPGRFTYAITHEGLQRVPAVGYVRAPFAVMVLDVGLQSLALLIHLPSGYILSRSTRDDAILMIADALAPAVPDWFTATVEEITEASKTFHARISSLGMRCVLLRLHGVNLPVWTPKPQSVPQGGEVVS